MPVILRMTTRICHVKAVVTVGERDAHVASGFKKDPARWVMTPTGAGKRIPLMFEREDALRADGRGVRHSTVVEPGSDRRVGFVTSGPAYMHVKESFPDAPVLKLGISCPLPVDKCRELAALVDQVVVVEEVEPLVETELKAAGIARARQGDPAAPGRTGAQRAAARRSPACSAKACRKRSRPQPCRFSRGRRRCAWPARTSASITRCRRSGT